MIAQLPTAAQTGFDLVAKATAAFDAALAEYKATIGLVRKFGLLLSVGGQVDFANSESDLAKFIELLRKPPDYVTSVEGFVNWRTTLSIV